LRNVRRPFVLVPRSPILGPAFDTALTVDAYPKHRGDLDSARDLVEIADSIKSRLEIIPVSRMDEVLARAMTRKPELIEWDETTTTAAAVPEEAPGRGGGLDLTAH
jgi:hypothetical protein